jgi:hypothetical protein
MATIVGGNTSLTVRLIEQRIGREMTIATSRNYRWPAPREPSHQHLHCSGTSDCVAASATHKSHPARHRAPRTTIPPAKVFLHLLIRHAALLDQPDSLKLGFPRKLSSLDGGPPVS